MYLKSLEMTGFKSFAHKTALTFLPPRNDVYSVTAIVGPNGSGKSNIADAIRWVLGEQSIKQLRGKKSEDIIFSGSESKGQLSAAAVTLTLDNRDHALPVEFDELVISRKAYRSGESEYLLNGMPVRLIDLQILLAKAQFAHGSYSVIGQGMIDRLLLQTPEERKDFFDEATGIKEFQIKRHQGYLKLTRTKEHVAQAEILLQEIFPRLRTLSRQVKKLEERQGVEAELRSLQENYYATLWRHHDGQMASLHRALSDCVARYGGREHELKTVQEELAGLAHPDTKEDGWDDLQAKYQEALRQKNALEGERAALLGRMQVEYAKAGEREIGWMNKKIDELHADHARVTDELSRAAAGVEAGSVREKKYTAEVDALSLRKTELRGTMAHLEREMMQVKSGETMAQMTGLRAAEAVINRRGEFGEVYGVVATLGRVSEEYRMAMDVAAGNHLSSIVVGSDKTASACIEFLRREQLGVATFLPLNKIKPRIVPADMKELLKQKGVHGMATDLISFDKKFVDVFSYIFGSTLVVDTLDTARAIGIGRVRMVTLSGDLLETSGSMRGGWRRKGRDGLGFGAEMLSGAGSLESMEKKLAELQNELRETELAHEHAQDSLRVASADLQAFGVRREALSARAQELEREIAVLSQELALAEMNPKEYDAAMNDLQKNKTALEKDIAAANAAVAAFSAEVARFHEKEEKKKQRIFTLQDAMQAAQTKLNALQSEKNQHEIALAKLETKQEDLANEIFGELRVSVESALSRGAESLSSDAMADAQNGIQKLKYRLSLIGGIDEDVVKEYEETKTRHEGLLLQLDDLKKAMGDLEEMIAELDDVMKKKRDAGFKKIRKEFARYFGLLFEGGKADVIEVYATNEEIKDIKEIAEIEDDAQNDAVMEGNRKKEKKEILTGIDVTANPPGKKLKSIQALSGGERTMTAIALVCAILHTNPSPFVVLDEVEAALDEANTLRFTKILHELAEQSQFILITHNRATMHAADALYGVSMGQSGVSQLLSVRLEAN